MKLRDLGKINKIQDDIQFEKDMVTYLECMDKEQFVTTIPFTPEYLQELRSTLISRSKKNLRELRKIIKEL